MAGRIAYYGNIVTSGLVLNLDAAKRDSYPGSGTTWRDISGFRRDAYFGNGTFQVNDGSQSYISFDGIDDYVSTTTLVLANNFTAVSWIKLNPGFGSLMNVLSGTDALWYPSIFSSKAQWYTGTGWRSGTTTFVANRWYQVAFRLDNSTGVARHSIYVNGQRESMTTDSFSSGILYYIGTIGAARYLNGQISIFQMYDIALTDEQVLQNYNSTKGRYGL